MIGYIPKSKNSKFEYYWHAFFEIGIFAKGFNGVWETISGILVLALKKTTFNHIFIVLTRNELLEDPHDRVVNFLAIVLQNLSNDAKFFAALYILAHGLLNIFLSIQLYRNKLWAYLVTIIVMILFITYQTYRFTLHHSPALAIITVFDILFVIIAWHEYSYQIAKK